MLEPLVEFAVGSYLGDKVTITKNQERRDNQQERLLFSEGSSETECQNNL